MHSSSPFISDLLLKQIDFAVREAADYIALSFVSDASDVNGVKEIIAAKNVEIPVITKVERAQAVKKFDDILAVSDGIMVARGDLGVDIPLEKVPLVQKEIILKCNQCGKPVITATQMLESMVSAARPTRAEVNDVANAIFDGTDAIMLSAETSVGKYPIAAVKTMSRIARETEQRLDYEDRLSSSGLWIEKETDELISYSACHVAQSLKSSAIVAFTQSGSTARRVSKYRPREPVLAITQDKELTERLLLHWGVYPFEVKEPLTLDGFFVTAAELAKKTGVAKTGDTIVITGGVPLGIKGSTNLLKVEKII
jgi:pyruvate kinase